MAALQRKEILVGNDNVPFLTPNRIDRILEYVDIMDVVGRKVWLTRESDRLFIGICPFEPVAHGKSLIVSPSEQKYYCTKCGEGGNIFKFVMKTEKISFVAAAGILLLRYKIPIYGF